LDLSNSMINVMLKMPSEIVMGSVFGASVSPSSFPRVAGINTKISIEPVESDIDLILDQHHDHHHEEVDAIEVDMEDLDGLHPAVGNKVEVKNLIEQNTPLK